jgi:hypothetical protein
MRVFLALVTGTVLMSALVPAHAEKRIFIITSDSGGYGVDRCLANGSKCGNAIATSYCKSKEFAKALSFRKVDRDDITGAVPTGKDNNCPKGNCEEYVAIECSR